MIECVPVACEVEETVVSTCQNEFLIGSGVSWPRFVVACVHKCHRVETARVFAGALGRQKKSQVYKDRCCNVFYDMDTHIDIHSLQQKSKL